jgi:hypothetical protein
VEPLPVSPASRVELNRRQDHATADAQELLAQQGQTVALGVIGASV